MSKKDGPSGWPHYSSSEKNGFNNGTLLIYHILANYISKYIFITNNFKFKKVDKKNLFLDKI